LNSAKSIKGNVLIVDDEEAIRNLFTVILQRQGYNVVGKAKNGAEAIVAVQEDKTDSIDVVLMDYRMPVMDGLEAAEVIKSIKPAIKIILCSAVIDAGIFQSNSVFHSVISKPVSYRQLLEAVGNSFATASLFTTKPQTGLPITTVAENPLATEDGEPRGQCF
jgi:two-component system chemotaxis response regulator CheY